MNEILQQMLYDLLEIQGQHLAVIKDERDNLKEALRIAQERLDERKAKIAAIKEALGLTNE